MTSNFNMNLSEETMGLGQATGWDHHKIPAVFLFQDLIALLYLIAAVLFHS